MYIGIRCSWQQLRSSSWNSWNKPNQDTFAPIISVNHAHNIHTHRLPTMSNEYRTKIIAAYITTDNVTRSVSNLPSNQQSIFFHPLNDWSIIENFHPIRNMTLVMQVISMSIHKTRTINKQFYAIRTIFGGSSLKCHLIVCFVLAQKCNYHFLLSVKSFG